MANCVFCQKNTKLTREHVIPDWLSELFPKNSFIINQFTSEVGKEWHSKIFQHKVKIVCEACNTGWMSKLESEVKPIIKRLIQLNKTDISKKEQDILSFWVQKTILMLNQSTPRSIRITQDLFHDIYKNKSFSKKALISVGWRMKCNGTKEQPIVSYEIKQITSVMVPKELLQIVNYEKDIGGFIWKAIFTIGPIVFEMIGHNMKVKLEINIKGNIFKTICPSVNSISWPLEWPIEAEGGLEEVKLRN